MAIPLIPPPSRTWQDIAHELASKPDREKVAQSADELNHALLDEERLGRGPLKRG